MLVMQYFPKFGVYISEKDFLHTGKEETFFER